MMNEDLIRQKFNMATDTGAYFAAYRLPDSQDFYFTFAAETPVMKKVKYEIPESVVFLFSPYMGAEMAYHSYPQLVYKNDLCVFGSELLFPQTNKQETSPTKAIHTLNEEQYLNYVNLIKQAIANKTIDKVVAARAINIDCNTDDKASLFIEACKTYPHASVYYCNMHELGNWIGASPELLLHANQQQLKTVALAGTLPAEQGLEWTDKELEEQDMIAFFIEQTFQSLHIENFIEAEKETVIAGSVKHLSTTFVVKVDEEFLKLKLHKLLAVLNPTPAVCGLPSFEAGLFISEHEQLERKFYSGFHGLFLPDGELHLYVNLRCAELFDKHATLYAGAGITAKSDAQEEWKETNRKFGIMQKILH